MTDGVLHTIYTGPRPMGDGRVAFSDECSKRFPMLYVFDGTCYEFRGRRDQWKLEGAKA